MIFFQINDSKWGSRTIQDFKNLNITGLTIIIIIIIRLTILIGKNHV